MPSSPQQVSAPATLANWRSPPFNRWAFRHVDQLLPTAVIANHGNPAPAWPGSRATLEGFALPVAGGARLDMTGFMRQTNTDGMLVLVDGGVAFEWLDEGMHPQTPHIVMSATKSVIGLLCGILVERGLLEPESPVTRYLPQMANTGYAGATVRQLLDMQAQPQLDAADLRRYDAATHWNPPQAGDHPAGLHDFFCQLPARVSTHGGPFRYLSANTDLLGWVIEAAAGRPLATLLADLLWSPLGASSPARLTLDREGAARATGGFCSSLRDFARIGQMMIDGGRGPHGQVVPADWIDDIASQGDRQAWATGDFAQAFAGLSMHYRSGWYVIDDAPQTLFAMGIHGQHLFVDRANRLVIAKLSSQPQPLDPKAISLTLRAVTQIRRCVRAG